mgnify:CR=1 FL=1
MKFHEFGDKNLPSILLIHGGGSSWWNYLRQARILSEEYRVILPNLNGHGEEYQLDYVSTEDSALEILDYIKENCGGKLFCDWWCFAWRSNCYGAFVLRQRDS